MDAIRSSSSSSHMKAHPGSDGGSAGTAWPTIANILDAGVINADAYPAMSVATPTGENTDFKDDRVGISGAAARQTIEHKQHMRERFPDTAMADLALLP
jgi:hypothetical protein